MATAKQVKLKDNSGSVVYPQTVTDAVAYTPASGDKQLLTTALDSLNSDVADLEYSGLNPGVSASPTSKDVEFASSASQAVALALTASKAVTSANHFSDIHLYHRIGASGDFTTVNGNSANLTVSADSAPSTKQVYAYGTATYRGSKTVNFGSSSTAKATINFVRPSYVGYIVATDLAAVATNFATTGLKKKVQRNIAVSSEAYTASSQAYFVVAIPKGGNVFGVSSVTQLGTLNAVLDLDSSYTATVDGVTYQLYIGKSKHNAGSYNFKITTTGAVVAA